MNFNLIILPVLFFFLIIINSLLRKFKFSLDKETFSEKHKSLLRTDNNVPLSGTYFFLPIITMLFLNYDIIIVIICSFIFLLGLLADLKILTSYKLRLIFQFLLISSFLIMSKELKIDTRIIFLNNLMNYDLTRIIICSFFFMVLINGFNLIDGTNCLCVLNFLIISIFLFLLIKNLNINFINIDLKILVISLLIFVFLNFFGKNFLGDGAVYGLSFIFGYLLLKLSIINQNISPYFVANLLWYPAFENLFSIIRRSFSKKNNYLPDNDHLHQLIFKFFKKKNFFKKKFILSSCVGIFINSILFINYLIGYLYYSHTIIQIMLIFGGIFLYLITYYNLKKRLS